MTIDFDKIRRESPLPDIIAQSGVKLDKAGSEFEACCPFHGEKTPSFRAYNKGGAWKFHCFGCGIHGDVIDYVRERYGYPDNSEAIKFLTGEERDRRPVSTIEYKENTNPYDGYDIVKPPQDAPEIIAGVRSAPILNPKRVNPQNGKPKVVTYTPKMTFEYRNRAGDLLGYVLRVEFDDKKITPGVWWTKNKAANFEGWAHGSYPSPRPMYRLELLEQNPTAQVLIVEGEKCADAANTWLKSLGLNVIALSWMGGGKSLAKTYWKSLKGRSVIIWPDNDVEGWKTALGFARPNASWVKGIYEYASEAGATKIKIVHISPESRPEGWDIADAIYIDKLPYAAISAMLKERVQEWSGQRFDLYKAKQIDKALPQGNDEGPADNRAEETAVKAITQAEPAAAPAKTEEQDDSEEQAFEVGRGFMINEENWRQHLIMKADGDGLKSTSGMNVALILQYERRFSNIFAWNEFGQEVYLMRRPPWDISGKHSHWRPRKLMETDIVACAGWLEYTGMSAKINDVGRIIVRVAEHNRYNPVVDALNALKWDGVRRIGGDGAKRKPWLSEYLGADNSPVNAAFGQKWLIGAVARAMQPGCKMDTMLVLEGSQGLKKSTALRVLSDGLIPGIFTDEMSDPNSKDAALQMQGAWIVEISELDAFRRAEVTQIKAWLARQSDRFRRPYGKIVEEFPRSCVMAGTVNPLANTGYLKDPTGARRFWPVELKHIDIQRLQADASQIWAEALMLYREGEHWWLSPQEEELAQIAQSERYEDDPYSELINEYTANVNAVRMQGIMNHLDIPKERRNAIVSRRISSHLSRHGWHKEERNGILYYVRTRDAVPEEQDLPI